MCYRLGSQLLFKILIVKALICMQQILIVFFSSESIFNSILSFLSIVCFEFSLLCPHYHNIYKRHVKLATEKNKIHFRTNINYRNKISKCDLRFSNRNFRQLLVLKIKNSFYTKIDLGTFYKICNFYENSMKCV